MADGLAVQNARKNDVIGDESTKNDNNSGFCNVFNDWKGGILTIGTFGYDPLIKDDQNEQNDVYFYDDQEESEKEQLAIENATDSEEEEEEAEDGEENPLIYAAYKHDYDYDYEDLLEMKMEEDDRKRVSGKHDEFEFEFENTKKGRTTLAELFSADSELDQVQKDGDEAINKEGGAEMMIKDKSKLSFAKKLIGEDHARPIHKLNRLIRRMLKRKIHPDIGLNKHNSINSKVVATKYENSESASLLPIQGAISMLFISFLK
ncbi:hypothetical protein BUALT_Bualt01G0243300 [Buddleja alternifolia]|uniref:Protein TILLER ANGLE CONTROL 1 n=1 Tax=Buddleja alternifolia TaxID=168488 RepID=A0AAV6YK70_9LAMI|nr:hypothetical protein BUALT_Bualt01G0243300 [Buddleja alternifolia]